MFEQILGIVLDTDRVDLCQINRGLKVQEITHSVSQPIPEEIKSKGTKNIGDFVREVCSRNHIQHDVVYSAIPCGLSMFRHIHIPFTDMKKLSKVYPFEVEQTLPCSLDEVVMDYHVIKTDRSSGTDILAAVVPKKILEEHLDILTSAGFEPRAVTLDSVGLFFLNQAFFSGKNKGINGVINLDQKKATLLIMDGERILFTRQIDRENSGSGINNLCDQIGLTLASFPTYRDRQFERIVLTGSASHVAGLDVLIRDRLKIKTESLYSFKNLPVKLRGNGLDSGSFLASPLGLCMAKRFKRGRAWNFLKDSYSIRKSFALTRQKALALVIFLGFIIALGILNLAVRFGYYNNRIQILENETQKVLSLAMPDASWGPETLSMLKKAVEHESAIQKRYGDFFGQDVSSLDILRELSVRIPKEYDILVQEIQFHDGKVMLKGKSETFETLEKVKSSLNNSKIFKNVNIAEANIKGQGNQVNFNIVMELNKI
ncbi:pilus assembly protein PilM [bacterium]|nr:pilus assembly protein PilM [bacterium]